MCIRDSLRTEDVLSGNVDGADFSTLTAVKSGRVYNTTLGMWNWFTPNPDAPLVLAWLACNTYPAAFAAYPLVDTIKEYYKTWYGYDVTAVSYTHLAPVHPAHCFSL